jgi:hypothetical protein
VLQSHTVQPCWIGPLKVKSEVAPGAIQVEVPDNFSLVHDTVSGDDIRPWLSHESHSLDSDFPDVQPHPAHGAPFMPFNV